MATHVGAGRSGRTLFPRSLLAIVALCGALFVSAPRANAELLVYSATDFVQRCPCVGDQIDPSIVDRGVLKQSLGVFVRYYTSVSFPTNGQRVCRFSLIYHDVNASENITARLLRKNFTVGQGGVFANPVVMATVQSAAGTPNVVRRATTTAIASPVIGKNSSFFYVEVEVPTINLNLLGVQIDVSPTCPA